MTASQTIEYPIVVSSYDPIKLSNGDLFLNHHMGSHLRIKNIQPVVERIMDFCDGKRSIAEITERVQAAGFSVSESEIRDVIALLANRGIMVEHRGQDHAEWLSAEQYERYSTLIEFFENFAGPGTASLSLFKKIRDARIGIVGMGGTGSLLAHMLAATGFGYIRMMDGDKVERSNLVRQIFYNEKDIGRYKVEVMRENLAAFNRDVQLDVRPDYVQGPEDALQLIDGLDFLFVEADEPIFLLNRWINEACIRKGIPYISTFCGQVGPIYIPGESACFTCYEAFIRQSLNQEDYTDIIAGLQRKRRRKYPSIVSGITLSSHYQFLECLSWLTGIKEPLTKNKIITFKLGETVSLEPVQHQKDCPSCGSSLNMG